VDARVADDLPVLFLLDREVGHCQELAVGGNRQGVRRRLELLESGPLPQRGPQSQTVTLPSPPETTVLRPGANATAAAGPGCSTVCRSRRVATSQSERLPFRTSAAHASPF